MSGAALLSTDDLDLSIDVNKAKNAFADHLDSLSIVTSYSHAMTNLVINPATSPPESWYTTLNENLGAGKQHALTWLTDIAPALGAKVPQTILDYNNTFLIAAGEIRRILTGKTRLTETEQKEVLDLIEATLDSVNDQKSQVGSIKSKLVTLATDFQADHDKLVTGQNSAAKAVELADSDRVRMEGRIAELQTKLEQTRAKVTASGIGLGLAIFVAVAAFALAAVTGGAGLLVVGAVGVIGIGTAATFTGIFTHEISELISEIHDEQVRLENKKRQVAALRGITTTVNSLKEKNEAARTSLTNIQTMWESLAAKLEAVSKNLKKGGEAAELAVKRMNIGAAVNSWNDTAEWAKKIQDLASGTSVQPVLQHDSLVRAFR
jgi:peptidoglycan hydrolase CwlO-like protein